MTAVGDIVGAVINWCADGLAVNADEWEGEVEDDDSILKRRNDCDRTPFTSPIPYNPPTIAMIVAEGRRRSFMSMDARIMAIYSSRGSGFVLCTSIESCLSFSRSFFFPVIFSHFNKYENLQFMIMNLTMAHR
jgi:hypothetical protein